MEHPLVQRGLSLGLTAFGSPTTSDQARIPYPSMKIGPGDSARSHTSDEYVLLDEIQNGIETYIQLLCASGRECGRQRHKNLNKCDNKARLVKP